MMPDYSDLFEDSSVNEFCKHYAFRLFHETIDTIFRLAKPTSETIDVYSNEWLSSVLLMAFNVASDTFVTNSFDDDTFLTDLLGVDEMTITSTHASLTSQYPWVP